MKILDRYVASEFLKLFLMFCLAAPVLFILGDWTDNLDTFTEKGLTSAQVGLGYLYRMPEYMLYSFPIAALIATVFTVSNMTRHSEMAAAKAGGISFYRALRMLPVLGVLLTFAGLFLTELVPVTEGMRREVMGERERESRNSRSEHVYATLEGETYAMQFIDRRDGGLIRTLTIERPGDLVETPSIHLIADDAVYDTVQHHWTLRSGFYRVLLDDSTERVIRFEQARSRWLTETPEQLSAWPKEPEEMRFAELGEHIGMLERAGDQPLKLMVERWQKLAIPVATLIIILFGAPLANTSHRGGPAYGIGISLGITIVYLMMFKVTEAAGATGTLPIFWAAWLPNVIFLAAGLLLLGRIRT